MNGWQLLRQLERMIETRERKGKTNKDYEGALATTGDVDADTFIEMTHPVVFISSGPTRVDTAHSDTEELLEREIVMRIVQTDWNDPYSRGALMGAVQGADYDVRSVNAGIEQLEEQLYAVVADVGRDRGVEISFSGDGGVGGIRDAEDRSIAWKDYTFKARIGIARSYPEPIQLTGSDLTGGNAQLDWKHAAPRFDRLEAVLRRGLTSGAPAPATISDGVEVGRFAPNFTAFQDNPGAGTWGYSLFEAYDEIGNPPAVAGKYSAPKSRIIVVT